MNPTELRAELEAGTVRGAYLLVGEEALLRDDALAALRAALLEDGADAFNHERLDGSATPGARLLDAVRTLPVMATHRLVVLRDPEGTRGAKSGLADALCECAEELAEISPPQTVLVVAAAKVDRRSRWVKAFGSHAVVSCDPPRGSRELMGFARAEAKEQGVAFERGALDLLIERTGPQLLVLRQEIAKAALLAGPGEKVTRAHVSAGASDVAEESIWALTDAVGEGRGDDALASLARLLHDGAPPPVVLGTLVSHYRKLLRARTGGDVPGAPFAKRKIEQQSRRHSAARLQACLRAIHDTDTAIKGEGALSPEMALERLVIGLSG